MIIKWPDRVKAGSICTHPVTSPDFREDIAEEHDLSVERPEMTRMLERILDYWLTRVETRIPERNPDYRY